MVAEQHTEPARLLSIIVPAWNESARIAQCLNQLHRRLGHRRPEIIVVDDGSTDGTLEAALGWMARHPSCDVSVIRVPHGGKGRAVYAGARYTHGLDVAYIDADMDIPAAEIDHLIRWRDIAAADVVVGSKRELSWRRARRPFVRWVVSIAFSSLVSRIYRLPVRDTQTGVKLFPGPWLRDVVRYAQVPGYLFDVELLAVAAAQGLGITEIPVRVRMRRAASRIGLMDGLRCIAEMAEVRTSVRRICRTLHPEA